MKDTAAAFVALSLLAEGESALIAHLDLPEDVQDHLMHLGFVPQTEITVLRRAPAGDPTVYRIDGTEVALRRDTAQHIQTTRAIESPRAVPPSEQVA